MTDVLSEIIDSKREVVARLRADRASQDFRQRALDIRKNAPAHRLLEALESDSQLNIIANTRVGTTAAEHYRGIQTQIAVSWNHFQRFIGD